MPTVACPTCGKMLNVPVDLLGKKVKCSACQGVFTAEAEAAPAAAPPEEPAARPAPRRDPERRRDDDEDRPRRRRDEYEDDEDRPRRRSRRDTAPHRGTLILVLGILGLVVCGPLGIGAWVMGNNDMREIRAGRMDPEGESLTNIGRILGMVATIFCILGLCMFVVWIVFFVAMAAGR